MVGRWKLARGISSDRFSDLLIHIYIGPLALQTLVLKLQAIIAEKNMQTGKASD